MTIKSINEIKNPHGVDFKPIKEKQDIFVPGIINENISKRNGMVYIYTGSGGSGKTSLMLNMFKSKTMYKGKFHNLFYFCPTASFLSVDKHPFEGHDKVYHELTVELLKSIYDRLIAIKEEYDEMDKKKKSKNKKVEIESDEEEDDKVHEIQYSCIIIDDFADQLKNPAISLFLSKFIIKARHLCCSFIFTLQSYFYYPKILRKQITYCTIFAPKNVEEGTSICKELMNLSQDDSLKVFNYVFDKPYMHLDLDLVSHKYYKNFNLMQIK